MNCALRRIMNYSVMSFELKIEKFEIAGEAENNSKIKIQNSKLYIYCLQIKSARSRS